MKRLLLNSTVAAIALLSASSAFANDYNTGVVSKSPSEGYTDVEFGSGWYLRGDITFNIRGNSESTLTNIATPSGTFGVQADYDDAVGARIGAGYYVSPNFRIEANVESVLNSTFSATRTRGFGGSRSILIALPTPVGGMPSPPVADVVGFDSNGTVTSASSVFLNNFGNSTTPINGTEEIDAEYSATSFLVSGYYDLPTVGQFTPYVGAGVGLGRLSYNESRTLTCVPRPEETCAFPAGSPGATTTATLTRNEEFWALAYQVSAGTAYRLNENLSLDVGYSYTNFEGGDDLSYDDGTAIDDDGFALHQVRAGIRYDIW